MAKQPLPDAPEGKRVLRIDDLLPEEIAAFEKRADIEWDQDRGVVTLPVEDPNAEVFDDPAGGVDAPPMPEAVRQRLEAPFQEQAAPAAGDGDGGRDESDEEASEKVEIPEPSPEDLRNYVRCLLGGERFTKTYDLFEGEVQVTFQERTTAQDEDAFYAAAQAPNYRATNILYRRRLAYSLRRLRLGETLREFDAVRVGEPTGEEGLTTFDKRSAEIDELPGVLSSAIYDVLREFDILLTGVIKKAQSPK